MTSKKQVDAWTSYDYAAVLKKGCRQPCKSWPFRVSCDAWSLRELVSTLASNERWRHGDWWRQKWGGFPLKMLLFCWGEILSKWWLLIYIYILYHITIQYIEKMELGRSVHVNNQSHISFLYILYFGWGTSTRCYSYTLVEIYCLLTDNGKFLPSPGVQPFTGSEMEDTITSAVETVELPGYLMKELDWLKDTTYTNNITLCHLDAKLQYTLHSELSDTTRDGSWQQISDGVLLWPEAEGKELDPSKVASRKEYLSISTCHSVGFCLFKRKSFFVCLCFVIFVLQFCFWSLREKHSGSDWMLQVIEESWPHRKRTHENYWFLVNLWRIFLLGNDFSLGGNQKSVDLHHFNAGGFGWAWAQNLMGKWCLRCLRWDFAQFCKGLEICDRCAWKSGMEMHCRGLPPNFSVPIRRFLVNKRFWGTWPWHCFFGGGRGWKGEFSTPKREVEQSRKRRKTTKKVNKI